MYGVCLLNSKHLIKTNKAIFKETRDNYLFDLPSPTNKLDIINFLVQIFYDTDIYSDSEW